MHLPIPNDVTQLRPTQLLAVKTKIISVASFAIGISAFGLAGFVRVKAWFN